MTYPVFSAGEVLTAANMNAVGLWRITTCTVTSAGGTAATASNGVITVGSGNTSVTVSNAFSSSFDNYKIIYTGGTMSVSTALKLQMGSTTTGYYGAYVYGVSTGTTVSAANDNNTSSFTYAGGNSDTISTHLDVDLLAPNLAHQTALIAPMVHYSTNFGQYSGVLANTTAYTAFTLIPFSGTMTGGTIRVYGYNK